MRPARATLLLLVLLSACAPKVRPDYYNGKHLRYWESLAASEDPVQRRSAVEALGKIGPHGVPTLLRLWRHDEDRRVRGAAMLALIALGPKAGPELINLMHDPDPNTRIAAAKAVGFLGRTVPTAVPPLTELLEDSNPAVRRAATESLRLFKSTGKPVFRSEKPPAALTE